MAYLSVPTRGNLFQNDKNSKIENWKKLCDRRRAQKTEEYLHRQLRKSLIDDNEHVTLNIGGTLFHTRKATLRNVPGTKLSNLDKESPNYDTVREEYFFDRNPHLFNFILDFYRYGTMHIPGKLCSAFIREELKFWELGDGCIAECCRKPYFSEVDENTTYELIKAEFYSLPTYSDIDSVKSETNMNSKWQTFKSKAWVFIDNHESSLFAKIFAIIYYGLIVVTILNLFISTLPEVRKPVRKHMFIRSDDDEEGPPTNYTSTLNKDTTIYRMLTTEPPDVIAIIDVVCLFFFTAEFVFRLIVCPSFVERVQSWYTLIDVLYLVPAWTVVIIDVSRPFFWQQGYFEAFLKVIMDAMLVSRVFRIFRLSRHYRGMRVLLLAFKASVGELFLLIVFVMLTLIIFSSLVYCAEQYQHPGGFESIFKGLWWSLITLTTVGYGDTYPSGTVGRIIACFCALTGLIIIGMVIPIIAGNFHLYYGFRHAGCEDFDLYKPEFVPSESENPPPDFDEDYGPLDRRLSLAPTESALELIRSRQLSVNKLANGGMTSPVEEMSRSSSPSLREGTMSPEPCFESDFTTQTQTSIV